jgi:hypothetical protein
MTCNIFYISVPKGRSGEASAKAPEGNGNGGFSFDGIEWLETGKTTQKRKEDEAIRRICFLTRTSLDNMENDLHAYCPSRVSHIQPSPQPRHTFTTSSHEACRLSED